MIVLLACLFAAVFLVGMALGVWLERAANRRSRGGTLDLSGFQVDYSLNASQTTAAWPLSPVTHGTVESTWPPPYDQEAGGAA